MRDLPRDEAIERQRNQFAEEAKEFWDSWRNNDQIGMLDGVADMMFVIESLQDLEAHLYPFWIRLAAIADIVQSCSDIAEFKSDTVIEAYDRVCISNLSKFDDSKEDAIKTHQFHFAYGRPVATIERNGWYICILLDDVEGFGHKGKILKSHKFKTVFLEDLL